MNSVNEERSLNTLISDLTRQTSDLVRKETELAKAELSEKMSQAQTGLAALIVGGAVLLVGLIYILNAVVYGLAEVLPADYSPWLAALIVGVVAGVVGYLLVQKGKADLKPKNLTPERTIESLQQDKQMVKEQVQ